MSPPLLPQDITMTAETEETVLDLTYQARVHKWVVSCFGEAVAADGRERNHRFLEEALELVQSTGCTASEAQQLVDYVFGRDIGEPGQEVGGVMNTLAALCNAHGLDLEGEAEKELARVWTISDRIRAKHAAKPKHSPLPGALSRAPEAGREEVQARDVMKGLHRWLEWDFPTARQEYEAGAQHVLDAISPLPVEPYLPPEETFSAWRERVNQMRDDGSLPGEKTPRRLPPPSTGGEGEVWAYEYVNQGAGPGGCDEITEGVSRTRPTSPNVRNVRLVSPSPEMGEISREELRDFVRSVAHSIPPSDFGSTRAINAMADAILSKLKENGLSREGLGGSARASRGAAGPSDCAEGDARLSDGGRDTTRLPARDLSAAEITREIGRVSELWDEMSADDEFEGHGGSPGEWMIERLDELETEQKRRPAPPPTAPSDHVGGEG